MRELDGVPVEQTENGKLLTVRGGWHIGDGEPVDGDLIPWPSALSSDPRHIEHLTRRHADVLQEYEGDPVLVTAIDPDEPIQPCTFCSTRTAIAERGIIDSDYTLYAPDDAEWLAHCCHGCIADADVVDP